MKFTEHNIFMDQFQLATLEIWSQNVQFSIRLDKYFMQTHAKGWIVNIMLL